ncbi:DNA repair protein RadA [Patescibacteria group bacterium]
MARSSSNFICQQCEHSQVSWFGKCPQCGEWNTAVESVVTTGQRTKDKGQRASTRVDPVSLASISVKSTSRVLTKIPELDRVLGGGLVSGQVVLIAGEPGIGKSTILLQLADKIGNFLYVSGEESVTQIKIRADRLGIKNKSIQLLEETDVDAIVDTFSSTQEQSIKGVVIDSIQTMATSDLSGMAGSVGQVRESAYRLVRLAKQKNVPIFIVGHVTKVGTVAGPSVLMHIVDTVLWFEGDKSLTLRLLRAVKNRFGPTDEVGVFTMEDKGLKSVTDPEKTFLGKTRKSFAGDVTACIMQGTRPILVEVQSLVVPTKMTYPKRISQGVDVKRLELLLAVLTRRCGLPFYEQDVFVNVAGGVTVKNDPSIDLAITLSCASSYFDKAFPKGMLAIGEVGLLGDIREVIAQEKRVKEAKRLGFKNIVTSKEIKYLQEAIKKYLR